ncbi:MAG: phosphoenolpyruvate--protein phosphotransferase [Sandaracinus sp.]
MAAAGGARVLRGVSASPGVAVGAALVHDRRRILIAPQTVEPAERGSERARLEAALEESRRIVAAARDNLPDDTLADHKLVLESHVLMHKDELFVGGALNAIEEGASAAFALRKTGDAIAARLRMAQAPYLRERARDVEDVTDHVLGVMLGRRSVVPKAGKKSVLVAYDLSPAETAQLDPDEIVAVVTEHGSSTSHTAVLARALHIPAVVGVAGLMLAVHGGARIIVDSLRGEVVVDPDDEEQKRAVSRARRYKTFTKRLRERRASTTGTRDGVRVELAANLELTRELEDTLIAGADGVGLFRTEFLYANKEAPDEEQQLAAYRELAEKLAPRPVTLRTFDLGSDKLPGFAITHAPILRGPNPALGLRGIRLALARPELFQTQLRAVLRAAVNGNVEIMFPMIATLGELQAARRALDRAAASLEGSGHAFGKPRIGVMIEVPSAVVTIEHLLEEADFVSIGTNDLAQYTLAIDREDPALGHLRAALEPAVLVMIRAVQRAASHAGKPATVCGDLAAHPYAVPILVGLGLRRLSMPPTDVPYVRELLSVLSLADCEDVAARAVAARSASEVEAAVVGQLSPKLKSLWRERGLE